MILGAPRKLIKTEAQVSKGKNEEYTNLLNDITKTLE